MALFTGTSGNDNFTGTEDADTFLIGEGSDFADGLGGNDTFILGALFDPTDTIRGGTGEDTLRLNGDYSLFFTPAMMNGIENIELAAGHDYSLVLRDRNLFIGNTIFVDASALGAGDQLTFNGSAETDGNYEIDCGAGDDIVTSSQGDDTISLDLGGLDTVNAGAGEDIVTLAGTLKRNDSIDGGADDDIVLLNGNYSAGLDFASQTLRNVEQLTLQGDNTYNLIFNDGNVAAGATLVLVRTAASLVGLVVDASAETDGNFRINATSGKDNITLGGGDDVVFTGGGADRITGGGGADQVGYGSALQSTGTKFDRIFGFDAADDAFTFLNAEIDGVDANINGGTLSKASFDADLAAAANAETLEGSHAVLFAPDAGNFAGHIFLVIAFDGTAGYQTGTDLVIELVGGLHLNQLDEDNFLVFEV
jgi:Ca2+-binding RTX toxin-like protein